MSQEALEQALWKGLESDRTVMLGIADAEDAHMRPMTAQFETPGSGIWFFTSVDHTLTQNLAQGSRAIATFTSKDHDLFASLHGTLSRDQDAATIDRLWNRFVAAWFEGGRQDPKLALLRLDPERAEIWEDASSFVAGLKMLIGLDPKEDYKDKVAEVTLR